MLKGHVFKKQIFGNQIFALFIDTFLNKNCGIAGNYKEKMKITYNGSKLTIASGAVCIRGRFLEEDTNTTLNVDTDIAFCKLVIEVDLSKENTEESLAQANYKIIKSASNYPNLTQTDIVANNNGIYQYELAQFKTSPTGITNFTDKRTYLDFNSIYSQIKGEYTEILNELKQELKEVTDGSAYLLKSGGTIEGDLEVKGGITGKLKQPRTVTLNGDVKGSAQFDGSKDFTMEVSQNNVFVLTGNISLTNGSGSTTINYPNGLNKDNCIPIAVGITVASAQPFYRYYYGLNHIVGAVLTDTSIGINAYGLDGTGTSSTQMYKLVLMKIK